MKNILIIFLFSVWFISCKKDGLMTFDGENEFVFSIKPGTYAQGTDSIPFKFAALDDSIKSLELRIAVNMIGKPFSVDQKYYIKLNEQQSSGKLGEDFTIVGDMIMRANSTSDTILIRVNRTNEMSKRMVKIVLELDSTKNNSPNFLIINDKSISKSIKIFATDFVETPEDWDSFYLGNFSTKKLRLLVKLDNDWDFDVMYKNVGYYSNYFGDLLYEYLLEQQNLGTPVLESDGTPMEWGDYFN